VVGKSGEASGFQRIDLWWSVIIVATDTPEVSLPDTASYVQRRLGAKEIPVLQKARTSIEQIALVIPHQANLRIIEAVANALSVPMNKVYVNVQEYGNTGSASVPLALDEAIRAQRIKSGDLVLLTAFGAGFHWAAALLHF